MTREQIAETADFIARYLSYMLGAGVHTSRVVRNSKRLGNALGVDVAIHTSQKTAMLTVSDKDSNILNTRVVDIPSFPISFEWNADLSALSWAAHDRKMTLEEVRREFDTLVSKPGMNPVFVLFMVSLANASFCRLFGDRLRSGMGDFPLLLSGSLLAFCGMFVVLRSSSAALCLAGYALMGAGLSPLVPLFFSRVRRG